MLRWSGPSLEEAGDLLNKQAGFNVINAAEVKPMVQFDYKKASSDELHGFMAAVLPNYDRDRVYMTDIKKLITWYNLLIEAGITDFKDEENPGQGE